MILLLVELVSYGADEFVYLYWSEAELSQPSPSQASVCCENRCTKHRYRIGTVPCNKASSWAEPSQARVEIYWMMLTVLLRGNTLCIIWYYLTNGQAWWTVCGQVQAKPSQLELSRKDKLQSPVETSNKDGYYFFYFIFILFYLFH